MSLMLSGALGGIRNIRHDYNAAGNSGKQSVGATGLKAEAGGYLWRKLGMLGLVTGAHTFAPKQFMHLVRVRRIGSAILPFLLLYGRRIRVRGFDLFVEQNSAPHF